MDRFPIKNRAFDRMGNTYSPVINHDHFYGMSAFDIPYRKRPRVNLKKNEEEFELQVAVPGFSKEEISVEVKGDVLFIKGEKENQDKIEKSNYILEEFDFHSFEKSFKLAPEIAKDDIRAKYEQGVLHLFFSHPKEEHHGDSHPIAVE